VLGVEAALWTETIRTPDELFSMLLPRLAATAEVAWSRPEVRDWEAFAEDLAAHAPLWEAHGFAFERRQQVFGPPS
jgi:hexosaminidase